MSFFAFLKRLFSVVLSSLISSEGQAAGLSALFKEIEAHGPEWYRPWTDRLTSSFALRVLALRRACSRMARVYARTIAPGRVPPAPAGDAILEAVLGDEGLSLEALSFDAIRMDAQGSGAEDLLVAMDELFERRLALLSSPAALAAEDGYRENLRFAYLAAFRWEDLLGPYRREASGTERGPSARFRPLVPASTLMEPLEDLYYLLSGLSLTVAGRRVFSILRDLAGIDGYGAAEAESDMKILSASLVSHLGAAALSRVIRASAGNAGLRLRADRAEGGFVAETATRLAEEYGRRRRAMETRIAAEKVEATIRSLFGEAPLLPVEGYTGEVSAALLSARLPGLDRTLPLSLAKSFLSAFFAPRIGPILSRVAVQLDYQDTAFRAALSDAADSCARLDASIRDFEVRSSSPSRQGLVGIVASSSAGRAPEGAEALYCRRRVEEFNAAADRIVQDCFERFSMLSAKLDELLGDIKARVPLIVADTASVNLYHGELIRGVAAARDLASRFLDLLRRVAVDAGAAKRAVDEALSRGGVRPDGAPSASAPGTTFGAVRKVG